MCTCHLGLFLLSLFLLLLGLLHVVALEVTGALLAHRGLDVPENDNDSHVCV